MCIWAIELIQSLIAKTLKSFHHHSYLLLLADPMLLSPYWFSTNKSMLVCKATHNPYILYVQLSSHSKAYATN